MAEERKLLVASKQILHNGSGEEEHGGRKSTGWLGKKWQLKV